MLKRRFSQINAEIINRLFAEICVNLRFLNSLYCMNEIKHICVYCASSTQIPQVYFDAARSLGTLLAERQINLVDGAGNKGLMGCINDAVLAAGGTVTGIIPRFMVEQGWHHTGLTHLVETETMHERKSLMAGMSDAVIALPGGCGTLEELLEIITWKQLGLYVKPIVILNVEGFYDPLIAMLERAIDQHFMRREHEALWQVASIPEEAVDLCGSLPLWNKAICKFVAS